MPAVNEGGILRELCASGRSVPFATLYDHMCPKSVKQETLTVPVRGDTAAIKTATGLPIVESWSVLIQSIGEFRPGHSLSCVARKG
jgi:hypothetical protein